MKKKTLFIRLIFLCTGLFLFASCSNMIDSAERAALEAEKTSASEQSAGKKVSFTGSVCVAGALPECFRQTELASPSHNSTSRSALPSFTIGTNYFYYVIASQKDGNGSVRINSIDNAEAFSLSSGVTFDLELSIGSWEIKCGICDRVSPDFLLSDTYPFTISDTNPSINHTFYPKPSQKGSGTVALQISYESGKVDSITAKCGNNSWSVTTSETQATIEKSSINSGAYDLSIYFFKNDDQGNPLPVYATNQTINVFDNMTTNTWVSDGSGLIDGSGVFTLTSELINQFARTTFYVGQTAAATSVEVTASDITGNGSPYAPFETVTKAVEVIAATGDSAKDYRIFVSGTVTGAQEISDAVNGKAKSITIQGYNGLDANGQPKDALDGGFSWESQGTVLTVSSCTVPITIKNLKITGGCSSASGGGISIGGTGAAASQKANLTLESGALITENYIRPAISSGGIGINTFGAGIYMYYGKLTMKSGAVITKNKTLQNESVNMVYSSGAGIGLNTGTEFLMEGGEITENNAYGSGGAICMQSTNFATDISVAVRGGLISGNQCQQGNGGSIAYLYGNSLTIGGSAYIPYGGAEKSNDIYLASGKTVTLTSPLTAHSASDPIAITPSEWTRGTTVVKADTNVTDLTQYKNYFTYTQDGWGSKVSTDKKSIYIDTPIYVAGQTNHPYCGVAGNNTTGDGTKAKPFATIAKAIELLTDKDTDYTIYIDGTISGVQTIPDTLKSDGTGDYNANSLTIDGVNGLDDTSGEPIDILDGIKASDSTLTVESDVPVTITNLKIINGTGKSDFKRGGGIYISDSASLALGDGALVTQNTAKDGGGIYNLGKLFLYGTAMVGMQTNSVATSDNWGNKATEEGAGIYSYGRGEIYLGYRNEGEKEELTGGVCGNYNANSRAEEPGENCGGGICMSSNFDSGKIEIASGNISYNYAMNGSGIYTRGHVTMTGGTIEGNEGNSADTTNGKGGGIYLYDFNTSDRTFTMSGNAVIKNNKNIALGAGVYLRNGYCKFEMNGGEISGNIALSNGGAVYMDNLDGSSSLNIQGSANIPYGGAVKNNDIYMSDTSQKVRITVPLSDRDTDKVIGLTPSSYTERALLEAGTGVTLADEAGKFTVTNNEWGILATGSLVKAENATTLTETLSALSANTVDNPYEILLYASSKSDFETIKSILKSNSSKYVNITLYCPGFTSLPESAFSSCTSLVGITLPYGITTIGQSVFIGCSKLSSLILPESLKSTSYRDLNGCYALKSIVLPESLETIGTQSFADTGLTSITIPKNVKAIQNDAFASSSSLAEVIVDSENQYFKAIDGVLYNKEGTKLLYYPAAKTGSFVIPNSVTQIGGYSFYHSQLSNLTIPESVTSIGDRAFEACSLTSITLPNSLKTIDNEAFALCSNFTTVTIPKSVTSIYRSPFSGCSNLTEIKVEEGNSKYVSVDGVLFDKDKTLLICYPAGSSATSYTIPNTVKTIGTYAFNRCSKLTSITISDSVEHINSYGIYSCTSLTSIIFTDTTTWYKTSKYTYTDGEEVDFTNSAANVSKICYTYNTYWYKE